MHRVGKIVVVLGSLKLRAGGGYVPMVHASLQSETSCEVVRGLECVWRGVLALESEMASTRRGL